MTIAQQRRWQTQPYNIIKGYASGALISNQEYCAIISGGTLLVGEGALIQVDDAPLFSLKPSEDGEMLVSITLKDTRDRTLAIIEDNEWISGDINIFDLQSAHQKLTIHQASRKIVFSIDTHTEPARIRADLWHDGQLVRLGERGISLDGTGVQDSSIQNLGLVGMQLVIHTTGNSYAIKPMLKNGGLISEADPILRYRKSIEAWESIKRQK